MMKLVLAAMIAAIALMLGEASAEDARVLHPIASDVSKQLTDPAKPFTLIVGFKVKDGDSKAFIEAFNKPIVETRKEKGNIAYVLSQSFKDPHTFMLYERWKSLKDLDAHLKLPHLTELLPKFDRLLAEPPSLTVHRPVAEPKE